MEYILFMYIVASKDTYLTVDSVLSNSHLPELTHPVENSHFNSIQYDLKYETYTLWQINHETLIKTHFF